VSSRRRHTTVSRDWSSDVCSSDLNMKTEIAALPLVSTLEHLTIHQKEFNEVIADLFGYNYEDYNALFEIDKISLDKDTHVRIPEIGRASCRERVRSEVADMSIGSR